ncbi:hypothetical protein DPMN_176185 [Dreissena polymorpha]|uniref:Uncharacterized protein n=1 Tax=Dreissena polymorpha TaxID=45954 RepID=A0A9D4E6G7_DREPO|nr:hypothetical protein DPMN_176185 [Dreissena polymorpha]
MREARRSDPFQVPLRNPVQRTAEVRIRITKATAVMARLSRLCTNGSISFPTKDWIYVVFILLYDCEDCASFTLPYNAGYRQLKTNVSVV